MKFLQDIKTEEEQHRLAQEQAKKDLSERILDFAKKHFIGEVIFDESRSESFEGGVIQKTALFIGRYFAISGKETGCGEPTNLYIMRERTILFSSNDSRFSATSYEVALKKIHQNALCFEEENPVSIEKLLQKDRKGNIYLARVKAQNPLFQLYGKELITVDRMNRKRHRVSGYICNFDFKELGMDTEEYSALFNLLIRQL